MTRVGFEPTTRRLREIQPGGSGRRRLFPLKGSEDDGEDHDQDGREDGRITEDLVAGGAAIGQPT